MNIWLDDIREPPPAKDSCRVWTWIKSYAMAIDLVKKSIANPQAVRIQFISFDHDLGTLKTGYDLAKYVEEQVIGGHMPMIPWNVHSANPVGRKNINNAMYNALEHYIEKH